MVRLSGQRSPAKARACVFAGEPSHRAGREPAKYWNMPKMDGTISCARCVGFQGATMFYTTEKQCRWHRAHALHAGANEYMMKPFDNDVVEAKFQEIGLLKTFSG
jgi:hypothetical protein